MSFTRADYEFAFKVAIAAFYESSASEDERNAARLLHMIENVIGQQSDFPPSARIAHPYESFKELPKITTKMKRKT